jgi:hypothetical protein
VKRKAYPTSEQYQIKEIPMRITFARKRAAFGSRYATELGAYELADMIKSLPTRPTIPQRFDSLDQRARYQMAKTAHYLLTVATTSTESLRLVADALDALDSDLGENPAQNNIITAYEKAYKTCGKRAPTFPEVRKTFVAMFGDACWRGSDYSVRKTLKSLELPLTRARLGRPRRAVPKRRRSQWGDPIKTFAVSKREIGNPGRLEE